MVEPIYQCTINKSIHFTIVVGDIFSYCALCVSMFSMCVCVCLMWFYLLFPRWKNVLRILKFQRITSAIKSFRHNPDQKRNNSSFRFLCVLFFCQIGQKHFRYGISCMCSVHWTEQISDNKQTKSEINAKINCARAAKIKKEEREVNTPCKTMCNYNNWIEQLKPPNVKKQNQYRNPEWLVMETERKNEYHDHLFYYVASMCVCVRHKQHNSC